MESFSLVNINELYQCNFNFSKFANLVIVKPYIYVSSKNSILESLYNMNMGK